MENLKFLNINYLITIPRFKFIYLNMYDKIFLVYKYKLTYKYLYLNLNLFIY